MRKELNESNKILAPVYNLPWNHPSNKNPVGETLVFRNEDMLNATDLYVSLDNCHTTQDILRRSFRLRPDEEYLGWRPVIDPENNTRENKFVWMTNRQLEKAASNLGSGIMQMDFVKPMTEYQNHTIKPIGIYSKDSPQWIISSSACSLYGLCPIPLYDTLGQQAMHFIVEETNVETIFIEVACQEPLSILFKKYGKSSLKNFIIMNTEFYLQKHKDLVKKLENDYKVKFWTFEEIQSIGEKNPKDYVKVYPESLVTLCYTSGTTGNPKGTMLTEKNITSCMPQISLTQWIRDKEQLIYLSFLPYAHIWERINIAVYQFIGAKWGLYSGDVSRIGEDLQILKPNLFNAPPRLMTKLYSNMISMVKAQPEKQRKFLENALREKIEANKKTGSSWIDKYDNSAFFTKIRASIGGNVKLLFSGSAPMDPVMIEFLAAAFGCAYLEGYGQTEACGAEVVQFPGDTRFGTIGGCQTFQELKLVDVPEMNYTAKDLDANGRPAPRGEVCVRGPNVCLGYYKQPELTKEAIDSQGWLHSGDIGMLVPETNALKIIDRKKNIFKLSQGEYVAPDRLQNIYKSAYGLADVFVEGNSYESYLVAIVVPDEETFPTLMKNNNIEFSEKPSIKQLIEHPGCQAAIIKELDNVAKKAALKGFEKVKKVAISTKNFQELDQMTSTFKVKRKEAREKFKDIIAKLYKS